MVIEKTKREERIKAMLDEVEVSWEDYEESLAISPRGMNVIMQRDIMEMMVNSRETAEIMIPLVELLVEELTLGWLGSI